MFYDFLGSDPDNLTGSGSNKKVRIRPDPQHCFWLPGASVRRLFQQGQTELLGGGRGKLAGQQSTEPGNPHTVRHPHQPGVTNIHILVLVQVLDNNGDGEHPEGDRVHIVYIW